MTGVQTCALPISNRWVMLEEVGRSVVRSDVPKDLVEKTVRELTA